ncbi:hypothetical protein ACFFPI_12160 [Arthrobacter methylotrophus]|uniref:Uncharacterized protein n=2 Tax=Arthrobacter methylotrophus TaxID=121291 RepID=A0ABV5UQS3_9MICC
MSKERLRRLTNTLLPYFESILPRTNASQTFTIVDPETHLPATCCTQSQVAAFLALDRSINGGQGAATATLLAEDVRRRQNSDGSFSSNYNQAIGSQGLRDIAEIGASATALFNLSLSLDLECAKESLNAAAEYLLTQVAVENKGAIYKNAQARHVDILNGDIYAANTLSRAYQLTGTEEFLKQVIEIVDHVERRFGAWRPGWWPYSEDWDGMPTTGASVAYQATIVGFGMPICEVLPPFRAREWRSLLARALDTVCFQLPIGPNDDSEAPTWSRDWSNVWEIPLAFSRMSHTVTGQKFLRTRFEQLDANIASSGINAFRPRLAVNPGRTAVTTLFRKTATFAGILADIYFTALNSDEVHEIPWPPVGASNLSRHYRPREY